MRSEMRSTQPLTWALAILCTAAAGMTQQVATGGSERPAELIALLGDRETAERAEAELVEIGGPAVPALAAALLAQQLDTPTPVLRTLGKLRSQAVSAVPELLVALRKGSEPSEEVIS